MANPPISEVPDLMKIWDFERNENLDPYTVTTGSRSKAWFSCKNGYNHSSLITISHMRNVLRCSVCAGKQVWRGFNDFESCYPYESYFWDYEINRCSPWEVSKGLKEVFNFMCELNHPFRMSLCNVSRGSWCPHCAGRYSIKGETDLKTSHPKIAEQLDPLYNIDPSEISTNSDKILNWVCEKDSSHRWSSRVSHRTWSGSGCPHCAKSYKRSKAEVHMFEWISKTLTPHLEVIPNDTSVLGGKHIDIYIPSLRLGFEYNGNYWHKDKGDPDGPSAQKERLAREKGVTLHTIWEDDWTSDRSTWEEFIVRTIDLTQR